MKIHPSHQKIVGQLLPVLVHSHSRLGFVVRVTDVTVKFQSLSLDDSFLHGYCHGPFITSGSVALWPISLLESHQTSGFKNRSLDLTLSDYPAGNPEYVQTTPAGHILFGFEP